MNDDMERLEWIRRAWYHDTLVEGPFSEEWPPSKGCDFLEEEPFSEEPPPRRWEGCNFLDDHFFSHFHEIKDRKKLLEFRSEVCGAAFVLRKLDKLTEEDFHYALEHVKSIVKRKSAGESPQAVPLWVF